MLSQFQLDFGFPVPGARPLGDRWRLEWRGAALMGILNVTPDSFSDGGRHATLPAALQHAHALLEAGARFIDVGGESTRPGAQPVAVEQELERVVPVVRALAAEGRAVISVDTLKPEVADAALTAGAHLINDVSGLRNPAMLEVCARHAAPAVIMHMRGEPRTMQHNPHYDDVVAEVHGYLEAQARVALEAGLPSVMLDPGIGFGKTVAHNLSLLRALNDLTARGYPVLLGASRKRLIEVLAGVPEPARRDPGSLALHLWGVQAGVALLRVHDVAGHAQALRVWAALEEDSWEKSAW
ncbi:dihydropteroate synthase [Deinobacterium chartae]|uniref:Dihydropteroate synthase n=1 Tax=Deinobacterium chartae TaxID=521158 RepID=A0A841HVM3_9DEIO|nr:dihydropteroate synthase [Deinobacterium chartae]